MRWWKAEAGTDDVLLASRVRTERCVVRDRLGGHWLVVVVCATGKSKSQPPFETRLASDTEQRDLLTVLIESSERHPDIVLPAVIEEGLRFCSGTESDISSSYTCFQCGSVQSTVQSLRFNLDMDAVPQIPLGFRKSLVQANLREHRMPRPRCNIVFIYGFENKPLADCKVGIHVSDNRKAIFWHGKGNACADFNRWETGTAVPGAQ